MRQHGRLTRHGAIARYRSDDGENNEQQAQKLNSTERQLWHQFPVILQKTSRNRIAILAARHSLDVLGAL
jgi:hypothetical protein